MAFNRLFSATSFLVLALVAVLIPPSSAASNHYDEMNLQSTKSILGIQGLVYCKSGPKVIPLEGMYPPKLYESHLLKDWIHPLINFLLEFWVNPSISMDHACRVGDQDNMWGSGRIWVGKFTHHHLERCNGCQGLFLCNTFSLWDWKSQEANSVQGLSRTLSIGVL